MWKSVVKGRNDLYRDDVTFLQGYCGLAVRELSCDRDANELVIAE